MASYPPGDAEDPTGSEQATNRVIRGGSWSGNAGYCRSAFRGRSRRCSATATWGSAQSLPWPASSGGDSPEPDPRAVARPGGRIWLRRGARSGRFGLRRLVLSFTHQLRIAFEAQRAGIDAQVEGSHATEGLGEGGA